MNNSSGDLSKLRNYINSVEEEKSLQLLYEIFKDTSLILEIKNKLSELQANLYFGEKINYIFDVSPFEDDEDAIQMALTIVKGKLNAIDIDNKASELNLPDVNQ